MIHIVTAEMAAQSYDHYSGEIALAKLTAAESRDSICGAASFLRKCGYEKHEMAGALTIGTLFGTDFLWGMQRFEGINLSTLELPWVFSEVLWTGVAQKNLEAKAYSNLSMVQLMLNRDDCIGAVATMRVGYGNSAFTIPTPVLPAQMVKKRGLDLYITSYLYLFWGQRWPPFQRVCAFPMVGDATIFLRGDKDLN